MSHFKISGFPIVAVLLSIPWNLPVANADASVVRLTCESIDGSQPSEVREVLLETHDEPVALRVSSGARARVVRLREFAVIIEGLTIPSGENIRWKVRSIRQYRVKREFFSDGIIENVPGEFSFFDLVRKLKYSCSRSTTSTVNPALVDD